MTNSTLLQPELRRICAALLGDEEGYDVLYESANAYYQLLFSLHAMDDLGGVHAWEGLMLPTGKAISPDEAARCIQDFWRTKKFIKGFFKAVLAAREKFPGTPLQVLYAGTGPFATLALPITTVFSPDEVQFTLLEVQPESYQMLQHTIDSFDLQAYVRELWLGDATTYHPGPPMQFHIILTETMAQALDREPQVAITRHLLPFLHPEGYLVPEAIIVRAGLINLSRAFSSRMEPEPPSPDTYLLELDEVFRVDRNLPDAGAFPEVTIDIPMDQVRDYPELHLLTSVHVFGSEHMKYWQSSLTTPKQIKHHPFDRSGVQQCSIRYVVAEHPGFTCTFIGAENLAAELDKKTDNRFLKLPLAFDPDLLAQDLATCDAVVWSQHFNTNDYEGDWQALALRSATGAPDAIIPIEIDTYQDTELLQSCPYFKAILEQFECPLDAVRLLSLAPGSHIKLHRDHGLSYEQGCFRLHIPILTDPGLDFIVADTRLDMKPGSCWYANFDLPHRLEHRGRSRRVHLVIDGRRNAWTDALFERAGYQFEAETTEPQYDNATKREMIRHLEAMDSEAARGIIRRLRAELEADADPVD
ncbi:MAG: hypothetical protein EP344_01995 [Bacteroidetes bacterium]|nr:MAG: hypothetical protein EP344_01995 [Bacteroidota bacterium]